MLKDIYSTLGPVVLLPIPLGIKGPTCTNWQHVSYQDTRRADYRRKLIATVDQGGTLTVCVIGLSIPIRPWKSR